MTGYERDLLVVLKQFANQMKELNSNLQKLNESLEDLKDKKKEV